MPADRQRYSQKEVRSIEGVTMSASPQETSTLAVPALDDFDFELTDGAACNIDDPDCEACQ